MRLKDKGIYMNNDIVKEIRKIALVIGGILLLIIYSSEISKALGGIISVAKPFISGILIAFIINIPMVLIENKLLNKMTGKISGKLKRFISIILSLIVIVGVVSLVVFMVVPQLADTITDIGNRFPGFNSDLQGYLNDLTKNIPILNDYVKEFDFSKINTDQILSGINSFFKNGAAGDIVSSTVNVASSIVGFVINAIIAIAFAFYTLVSKEKLLNQVKVIFRTYIPENIYNFSHHIMTVLIENFKNFIKGQCLEAIILGTIFAVFMSIFRIPYVMLISVLIAFTALIPVAGAFIGCFVGAFFILMVSPIKMVEFLILFIVLQQLENKLIYPKVVGSSVGLPAIWVFVAVTVGGSLMGVIGMLLFIPITSTLYVLLKEDIIRRNRLKNEKINNEEKTNSKDLQVSGRKESL